MMYSRLQKDDSGLASVNTFVKYYNTINVTRFRARYCNSAVTLTLQKGYIVIVACIIEV